MKDAKRLWVLPVSVAMFFAGALSVTPAAAARPSDSRPSIHAEGSGGQKLLADEIVRRLRRLGINFNHSRLARPYDPEGELC